MFPMDIRLTGTDLTFMSFPELSGAHIDAVGVLTNPADHVSACEQGLGAVSAQRPRSQYSHLVTHPELVQCRLRGGLGSQAVLFLELLANLPRRGLLPL